MSLSFVESKTFKHYFQKKSFSLTHIMIYAALKDAINMLPQDLMVQLS